MVFFLISINYKIKIISRTAIYKYNCILYNVQTAKYTLKWKTIYYNMMHEKR